MATDVPPPTATTKRSAPTATAKDTLPTATAKEARPTATAKDTLPSATAKDAPPTATAKRSAPSVTAKDTLPTATAKEARPPAIDNVSPTPKPAADYDGFTVGIVDDEGTSGQTTPPVRPRPAKQPKLRQKPDSIEGPWARQQSVDQAEDEKLKRKLTICRGCKG